MPYTLITGASTGIGEVFAYALAKEGHNLILVARSQERLEQIATELRDRHHVKVEVITLDLATPTSAERLLERCQQKQLEVDTLINNAGFGMMGSFDQQDLDRVQEMIFLNLVTPTKLIHLFLPMLKQYQGRICNVASTAGFQPLPYTDVYSATKAYLLDFSEAISAELKSSGVSVTTLCPGPTQTPFFAAAGIKIDQTRMIRQTPEQVVEAGIRGLKKRKRLVVPGWLNKLMVFSVRLAPRSWVLSIGQFMMGH